MPAKDVSGLVRKTGYTFSSHDALQEALTHTSARSSKCRKGGKVVHENERLEFLGDRVLGLVIAEWLIEDYPNANEGELATKLNGLVRKEACADAARSVALEKFIVVGRSERSGGIHKRMAILGDAMEAFIAAVYADGGLEPVRKMIRKLWKDQMAAINELKRDPKTALQEWAQGRGLPAPTYDLISRVGPDHNPKFEIAVTVEGCDKVCGKGKNKRAAEQEAATNFLHSNSIEI